MIEIMMKMKNNDETVNLESIKTNIGNKKNIFLNINANPDKINIKDNFSKNKSHLETLRVLTKQLKKVKNSFDDIDVDHIRSANDIDDDSENEGGDEEEEDDDEGESGEDNSDEDDEERKSEADESDGLL